MSTPQEDRHEDRRDDGREGAGRVPGAEVIRLPVGSGDEGIELAGASRVELAGEVLEGEIVAEAGWRPGRAVERRPVVAPWLRDAAQRRQAVRWAAGQAAHLASYHAVRAPVYAARLAGRCPRGLARAVAGWWRWVLDAESAGLRRSASTATDGAAYLALARQRDARVRARVKVSLGVAVGGSAGVVLASILWPPAPILASILTGVGAGCLGRRKDRPIVTPARLTGEAAPRLTAEVVTRALGSLGIAEVNKAIGRGPGITFAAPITRDGPGWRADVDLPYGVTAADIIACRAEMASGLRRPLGCVWPEPAHEVHAGRLVLWVGDRDMSQARPAPWPLGKTGRADLFAPVPFGTDPRGRWVTVQLMYSNVLIGAMPGAGKTFALRVLLLAAALDPTAELRIFELKGSGDLSPLEPVCHRYASGPDDTTIEHTMTTLREVYAELERRAKTISGLPREICPENKVTRELADRRRLGLHPLVVGIDECQELFTHPVHGKEAGELATAIIKRGRALGVILILATQRPDKDSLPTGVSANVGTRFCLRVMGQIENDMILGTSAYKNGLRASTFTPKDRGIGYLVGAADEPAITRSAYLDAPAAEAVITRARALREQAGTITGHAAGQTTGAAGPVLDVLAAVAATFTPAEDRLWTETILTRLAEHRPGVFTEWTSQQLAAALKVHGLAPRQVWATGPDGQQANRRGYLHADITAALTRHHDTTNSPDDSAEHGPMAS
ncbi:MAG TPA: FtsK/SpoIIIE domain-containing protein [Mycobacteriales bacterium]|nr:FtsK/SpoIIIE domain-containing protein [Mycobacteriales bacterium]